MPHRRRVQEGSFANRLDELVKRFPAEAEEKHKRSPELQEKIELHARLFRQAWELDDRRSP
jgi:hypothetical protein